MTLSFNWMNWLRVEVPIYRRDSYRRARRGTVFNPFLSAHIPYAQSEGILPKYGLLQWVEYISKSTQWISIKLCRDMVEALSFQKNIKTLLTFDLHSRSRDPRWPPNTFFKVKFGPKTTHNSANFWSNSIIFVLFCCWRPVLHFGWKSNTNNGFMCLLAPEKRPSYTSLHYYGKLHCCHFQLRMMGKLIQTVTVPPLISLQWHINAFRKVLLRAAHSVIVK